MAVRTITAYDDPNFQVVRHAHMPQCQAGVSLTNFAAFRTRNKCVVTAANVRLHSAASAAAGAIAICRRRNSPSNTSLATIATYSLTSATSAGSIFSITLPTLNTLTTIHDAVVCVLNGNDKGKWDIVYEYQMLSDMDTLA